MEAVGRATIPSCGTTQCKMQTNRSLHLTLDPQHSLRKVGKVELGHVLMSDFSRSSNVGWRSVTGLAAVGHTSYLIVEGGGAQTGTLTH